MAGYERMRRERSQCLSLDQSGSMRRRKGRLTETDGVPKQHSPLERLVGGPLLLSFVIFTGVGRPHVEKDEPRGEHEHKASRDRSGQIADLSDSPSGSWQALLQSPVPSELSEREVASPDEVDRSDGTHDGHERHVHPRAAPDRARRRGEHEPDEKHVEK